MKTIAMLILVATAGAASAADFPECKVRTLAPVIDAGGYRNAAGKILPADILRRDEHGVSYCAHGGTCVPERVRGRQVVRLINCRPGKSIGNGDYRLDPDSRTMGAADARRFLTARQVGDKLVDLDFSNAAIGSWSSDYATNPASPNGRLVARALAGSKEAIAKMKAKLP